MNAPTRVFALYAMTAAGYGDLDQAFEQAAYLGELDRFSRATLALTFQELGEDAIARQMLDEVLREMVVDVEGLVYAPDTTSDGHYDRKFMSSRIRTTAMVLKALIAIEPDSDYREGMVEWLLGQRDRFGWGSTNETSFSLLALTDHIVSRKNAATDAEIGVYVGTRLVYSGTLSMNEPGLTVSVPVSDLSEGANEIRIESSTDSSLYYLVSSRMNLGQARIDASGIPVSRVYLDPETMKPITRAEAGDLVIVRLTVNAAETGYYVMLEDFLPGGLEALNEGLNNTGHNADLATGDYSYSYQDIFFYDQLGYNNKELRSDRVIFFISELSKGARVFQYVARATVSGEFIALPAQLTAMYEPEFWGRSASAVFTVTRTEPVSLVETGWFRPE
jgi:uncharacterized protein YfaS (alpha-2-macroglobulin family)